MGWLGLGTAFARFDIDLLHSTFTHSFYHLLHYHIHVLFPLQKSSFQTSYHHTHRPRVIQPIIITSSTHNIIIINTSHNMTIFNFIKSCFCEEDNDPETLPLVRIAMPKCKPMNITSYLPISARPIPQLDVTISSSTSIAMFEHESIASMGSRHNSFTSNGTFDDVDLSTPTKFAQPPKARKVITSPFSDQHEIENTLFAPDSTHNINYNGKEVSNASICSSNALFIPGKQLIPTASSDVGASPFDDEHGAEPEVEFAPTSPSSEDYDTERAMEYQRGKSPSPTSLLESKYSHADFNHSFPSLRPRQH